MHVLDICRAICCTLAAPPDVVRNQIFNVGPREANYTVRQIAELVHEKFSDCEVTFGPAGGDNRSYRVNFDKIHDTLPGFEGIWSARDGVVQLYELFSRIDMPADTFEFRAFTRLKQLKYLLATAQIDSEFFWSKPST